MGDFWSVDPEQADSAESTAAEVFNAQRVTGDDRRHADPGDGALVWLGALPERRAGPP